MKNQRPTPTNTHPLTQVVLTGIRFLLLFALCALLLAVANAQSTSATLSGTVVDQNGAVIPSADITITNTATGLQRTATSNDSGFFTVPLLPPSTYTVRAQHSGFSPVEIPNVVLNVGDNKSIQIPLKAGDVNATVTVDSSVETVRTDGSVGTVVDRQFVANIPLNGRSLQALIQLTPGVVLTANTGVGATATGSAQFSVNGQRTTGNSWMVDGVSANTGMTVAGGFPAASGAGQTPGTTTLGGTNSLVSLDALQEFRIETSTYAAEFGRTPGGQISLLTRSGTNQFHGSASYYFRNEALDANDWFANANRRPKPKERQNLFGGVVGGPINRDRFFFFASYEGLRLKQPKVTIVSVPTATLRAQAVPDLRPYLNALPLPNGQDFGNGTAQFAASYSDPGRFNIFAVRLDGRMTNSLTGFFRFSHAPSETKTRIGALSTVQNIQANNNSYTLGVTWVAGSQLTTDVRVNWTRNATSAFSDLDAFGGAVIPKAADIFLPGRDPSKASFVFLAPGVTSFNWGPGTSDVQRQFNAVGTVAWSVGSHQLKFGVDYRRLLPLFGATGGANETLGFFTAAQVLNAQALFYSLQTSDPVPREAVISSLSLFGQDTWHVGRRLTLSYGLRFERVPPPTEASGRQPRVVLGIENDVLQNPRLAPQGTSLFHRRFGSFAPRFGATYQLNTRSGWEAILRGGAGIFYDIGLGNVATAFQNIYPFFASRTSFSVLFPLSPAVRTLPTLGVDPPNQLWLLDPNLRLPYTAQWNASWEQSVGTAQSITAGYVGAAGRRLLLRQTYVQALADWPTTATGLIIQRNLGSSSYHALQVQYQRRLRRGVQALASYTLARSRDNASADDAEAPPASQANLLMHNFGPSDFDVRQVLSAAVTYDLPKLSGPALLRASLNGWGLDVLIRYQSAFPVNPTANLVIINGARFTSRPDVVAAQPLYINDPTVPGGRRFNRAAFAAPAPNQQGNFPRNGLRGFPASQVDLALRREFKVGERIRLQLRGELFNLFNHPNFGAPVADISNGLFGQPISMLNQSLGGLNGLYQMGGPRSGQLAAKLIW